MSLNVKLLGGIQKDYILGNDPGACNIVQSTQTTVVVIPYSDSGLDEG